MKFLCPSCKAKYQIADDKVAGRSVRMKCRKCGHMISLSKVVTEGSVSHKLDELGASSPPASTPAPPSGSWREPGARHTPSTARAAPARPAPAPRRAPPPRREPSVPRAAPPPRPAPPGHTPSPGGALAARQAARLSQPTVIQAPSEELLKRNNGAAASHAYSDFDDGGFDDDERTVVASVGGLAASFAHSVTAPEAAPLSTLSTPADEWYVGINGVPVGPIRLSELRSKASSGTITLDSLVWRDGFEEWIPLRTFPELVAIVEEGVSSARASLTPLSPQTSAPPGAVAPVPAPKPEVYDPFAMPTGTPPAANLADPFAMPGAAGVAPQTGPAVVTERGLSDSEFVIPKRRSGTPMAAWIAVAAALICGLGIGFVLFDRDKPTEPIVKYVEVPAKDPGKTTGAAAGTDDPENPQATDDAGTKAGGTKVASAGGPVGKTNGTQNTPSNGKTGGLTGLKGLGGLSGPGPTGGPSGNTGASAHPDGLDGVTIQKTVSRYTGSVKRSCWQPALDTRAKDAPSSARVSVTIHVAPGGNVSSVSSSGDPKGYRGLASCITSRVRGWQFPQAGAPTTVNVPFVFAAQ